MKSDSVLGDRSLSRRTYALRAVFVASVVAISATACGGSTGGETSSNGQTFTIGIIGAESGPTAFINQRQSNALRLWQKQANEAGGVNGFQIKIVTCNTEGKPANAAACARDIADDVDAIASFTLTAEAKAALPVYRTADVPVFMPTPNLKPTPKEDPNVFQTSPSDLDILSGIGRYVKDHGGDHVGVVAATDASGEAEAKSALAMLPPLGLKVDIERIDTQETDASVQLTSLLDKGVDVIYVTYTGGGAAAVVKSYNNLNTNVPLILSYGNVSSAFLGVLGETAPDNLYASALRPVAEGFTNTSNTEVNAFFDAYRKEFNDEPDMLTLVGRIVADQMEAILRNVENPRDMDQVRRYLESTPIEGIMELKYSPDDHIGLGAEAITIVQKHGAQWGGVESFKIP